MRIFLQYHLYEFIEKTFREEIFPKFNFSLDVEEEYKHYIENVYLDYHQFHINNTQDINKHEETCSWCNFHAFIFDMVMGVHDYDTCRKVAPDKECQDCLKPIVWYKKL